MQSDVSQLPRAEKLRLLELLDEKIARESVNLAKADLIQFALQVYPGYSVGPHHKRIAKLFKDVAEGRKKRIIINVPPRHGKSELSSYLFPSWFLGRRPDAKIIMATHTASLSEDFGRRVRNLVHSAEYAKIFPDTQLSDDFKGAGAWSTTAGGRYYAVGVGGALAGRGADLLLLDDPHSEQDVRTGTRTVFDQTWQWYQTGPRQRLQWGGAVVVLMCVEENQRICMSDGVWKPIRDVQVGDLVVGYEAQRAVSKRVTAAMPQGEDALLEVVTRSCSLKVNKRHPFLVVRGGLKEWMPAGELRAGDTAVTLNLDGNQKQEFRFEDVEAVRPAGRGNVVDITVEGAESFVAEGFVVHNTRWSLLDLSARLIDYQTRNPDADQWEVIEFPAIMNENTDKEKSLWPDKWPLEELRKTRASLDPRYWAAQYQQNPTAEEGALIKREWWRMWEDDDPPACDFIIQTWDTAHDTKTRNDFSACTTWGLFQHVEDDDEVIKAIQSVNPKYKAGTPMPHIIMLDAFRERMEFPDLKEAALKHYKLWRPDACIIEKKAAGAPLIQEMRLIGVPVQEYSPSRGNDKTVRLNAVADLFRMGKVWAPETRWAREVIEEVASFPVGEHDDYVDCTSMALLRFRQGHFIRLDGEEQDEPRKFRGRGFKGYY